MERIFSDKVQVRFVLSRKRCFQRSLGKRLKGRAVRKAGRRGTHGWLRKYREHCGHENRGEGSWPERFVF